MTPSQLLSDPEPESSAGPARTDVVAVEPHGLPVAFPAVGDSFLGFQLVAVLGSGGFGKVFLARELALGDRAVALKVTTRPTAEPARLGKLRHPNVVPVHSVHDRGQFQAICMPYLGRRTLADWLDSARAAGAYPAARAAPANLDTFRAARTLIADLPAELLPEAPVQAFVAMPADLPRVVAQMLAGLARGLAHAHARGILHLDIKPANVLLPDAGEVMLLDFNLAHDREAGPARAGGTVPYMAPEQLDAHSTGGDPAVGEATDLFALGVLAYELLSGVHPFAPTRGRPDLARLAVERRVAVRPVRHLNAAIPAALAALVERLLCADPAGRYPSAAGLATDLATHLSRRPTRLTTGQSWVGRAIGWGR